MRKTLVLLASATVLLASNILNYDVYNRSNRVDVMFTFDTPYQGSIQESQANSQIILKLHDLTIQSPKVKAINSKFISKMTITPMQNDTTQIVADIAAGVHLQVSKTADEYGLRLRFIPSTATPAQSNVLNQTTNDLQTLPTQQGLGIPMNYYIVVSLLIIAVIVMFFLKRKLEKKTTAKNLPKTQKGKWFFKEKSDGQENDITVRFTKKIDQTTNVMMIDYGNFNYLVLHGNSTVLLDKFENNQPISNNNFDALLQEHTNEIEQLLHVQKEREEPFQTYKEKASSTLYDLN